MKEGWINPLHGRARQRVKVVLRPACETRAFAEGCIFRDILEAPSCLTSWQLIPALQRAGNSARIGRTLPSLPKGSSYGNYAIPPGHGHRIPPNEISSHNNLLNNHQINQTLPDLTSVQTSNSSSNTPPLMSPIMSNYSLSKNINHLNLNLMPRTNSGLSSHVFNNKLESPFYHTTVTMPDHGYHYQKDPASERIEVQILPQDNDWGDNTTTVTGLSDLAFPSEGGGLLGGLSKWSPDENLLHESGWRFLCQRYAGSWFSLILSIIAFLSPILMVILPKTGALGFERESTSMRSQFSIQRCAAWALEKYYTDFPVYNPYLERLPTSSHHHHHHSHYKGSSNEGDSSSSPQSLGGGSGYIPGKKGYRYFDGDVLSTIPEKDFNNRSGMMKKESHNERFYEELEYDSKNPTSPLDSYEAAQAIFPTISRPLQKISTNYTATASSHHGIHS
ncbi:VANGL [Lepeophtheirus salmonis]|uniref:VANGL n=1 Tax=Lepeophtheirus salmonis TaxID=72036 RepID=A0A7R8CJY2_LEPSM|nr:VANGL [Lepeophtheirus salmonis]CAF2844629.1 VANGL [Lepeophtheirus salmonis]